VLALRDREVPAPEEPAAEVVAVDAPSEPARQAQARSGPELPDLSSPLGVYRAHPEQVPEFEGWLGRDVTFVLGFYGRADDWSEIENPSWLARRWQGTGYTAVRSIAMLPNDRTSLAAGAAGRYDRYWRSFAETFVEAGEGDAILRLGWEFNGKFYPWSAVGQEEEFARYWRRIVDTMRAVPGAEFSFDWCPLGGNTNADLEMAYPGDDYVDFIGLDAYDTSPVDDRQARWDDVRDRPYGLRWHKDFATARGNPMTFPEWGLTVRYDDDLGGGDNPVYLRNMYDWIAGNDVAYALYFEADAQDARHRLMNEQFPNGSAAFRQTWGR
jgi:hypothetical protein